MRPRDRALPPQDHLLNWALEIFGHHLTLLANPGMLPEHPWLQDGWLPAWLAQQHALSYERMLSTMTAWRLDREADEFLVEQPLEARRPQVDAVRIDQGHYRIGARKGVVLDCELPTQMVELHSFPHPEAAGQQCRVPGLHPGRRLPDRRVVGRRQQHMARRHRGTRPPGTGGRIETDTGTGWA